jgi:aryl sulfotransferase
MDDPKKIVWLASYPKSGNTWFRAFLTALLNPGSGLVDINNMHPTTIASSRQLFDEMAGVASADLTADEIDRLRPLVYRQNALEATEIVYHKIHDAWTRFPDGKAMFPEDVTKAVIYIIRNPLDVAVSFAHHLSTSIDRTIAIMNNPRYAFCGKGDRLHNQLQQRLSTWSGHVTSWVDESGLPVLVLRYEDMKTNPFEAFSHALSFIGLKANEKEIQAAVAQTTFDSLKQQESEKGFSEKNAAAQSFFRKGIVGDWRNSLSRQQIRQIIESHRVIMNRYGYLLDVDHNKC